MVRCVICLSIYLLIYLSVSENLHISFLFICLFLLEHSTCTTYLFIFVWFQALLTMVPREFTFEPKKIDLGIVIGGSVGGLAFLIIVGIVLWKVRFWGVMIHTDLIYQSIKVGNTKYIGNFTSFLI